MRTIVTILAVFAACASSFSLPKLESPSRILVAAADDSWRAATDPNGRTYYWNVATRETTWERPASKDEPETPMPVPSPLQARSSPTPPEQASALLTWSGPSRSLPVRLIAKTRESVEGGLSALGAKLDSLFDAPERQSNPVSKGLFLGGVLAAATVVL